MNQVAIIARVHGSVDEIAREDWNRLWAEQPNPTPFMRHEYLRALEASGSASVQTGWQPAHLALRSTHGELVAACPVYLKTHSYGEYVFDWAWANAYAQHGLEYYPKALVAVPFTPVPGTRLMAKSPALRERLLRELQQWCSDQGLSSAHLLFVDPSDLKAAQALGWMQRQTVQFHWQAATAHCLARPRDLDALLQSLTQEKRKKIRQERRKVADAGVRFRWRLGADIGPQDWEFFYRCYEQTYLEHGNPPYLTREFFAEMARNMTDHWLMFLAEREGRPIAASLVALNQSSDTQGRSVAVAYGRYWGALERVDCLHFEACYYQPLAWCLEHGFDRFEGGAQGEHKMARALLPTRTHSMHWLAHPAFADAVHRFLEREDLGIEAYWKHLETRNPFSRRLTSAD
ncbi:GNAT family N-acetyltransferase [Acidovorax lacteus]|uniref:GNAT family N-acetyltransferase n=1 Tax=Acidovorax lacteus TaxID=1924988 RepID=A0ABP8L123_9BURK